jgi:D-alanyl-lipoteichoic acid acyltransferase DltB (MBOAT superfamily)
MRFVSYEFLLLAAAVFLLYYTVCRNHQWQLLLMASAVFYAFSGWLHLAFIAATVVSTYAATRVMAGREQKRQRRGVFALCLAFNIGILAFFKYSPLPFPLGLSFYTLQTMGYLIDCYRGKDRGTVERNPFKLALFTSFFPQLTQGPISRFGDLRETLYGRHSLNAEDFTDGTLRVALGLFKKLVVADRLMPLLSLRGGGAWWLLSALLYAVTIYCDFTGGLDIAIGLARVFGIKLAENFNRPFYARSVTEYWRRWHITMGTWFRDYIFYPLSVWKPVLRLSKPCTRLFGKHIGKRVPVWLATMVTWLATGFWHGASWNFILWGLLNGIVILASQEFSPLCRRFHQAHPRLTDSRPYAAFQVLRTFLLVAAIRSLDLVTLVTDGATASSSAAATATASAAAGLPALPVALALGAAILFLVAAEHKIRSMRTPAWRVTLALSLTLATLIFGAYGIGYDGASFIYTRF